MGQEGRNGLVALKLLDLLPGELKQLIHLSGADFGEVPDFLRACLEEQPASTRTFLQIREESGLDHASLARHLNTLASPARVLELRRVARRRLADRSWVCLPPAGERGVTALMTGDDDVSTLLLFETAGEWVRWVMKGFDLFPLPGIPLLELPAVPADTWMVFASLCDEFLARYPVAQANWRSDESIRFRADNVIARLDGRDAGGDSWVSGFRSVACETSQGPGQEDLEPILWRLCNEGLLVGEKEDQGIVHFTLSRSLAWLVRALTWWDRGFWIASPDDPDRSWLVVQAAGLWVMGKETTAEGTAMYKLDGVSGDQLSHALADLVRSSGACRLIIPPRREEITPSAEEQLADIAAWPDVPPPVRPVPPPLPPPAPPAVPVTSVSPAEIPGMTLPPLVESRWVPSPDETCAHLVGATLEPLGYALRLCSGCGQEEHSPEARFCRECGRPLPTAPAPARPAFCNNCGQPLEVEMRFCPNCGQAVASSLEQAAQ